MSCQAKGRGKGTRGFNGTSDPSPALITSFIKKACTMEAVFETFSEHGRHFNHIHLSACWSAIGRLAWSADSSWFQKRAGPLDALVQDTISALAASETGARQLANIAHGMAKSGFRGPAASRLMVELGPAIEQRVSQCNAQELANVAWAFAKSGQRDAKLFDALARASEQWCSTHFNAQELANTAWGFATAGHEDAALFWSLARGAENRIDEFSTQGLANIAWAFAKASHLDVEFLAKISLAVRQRVEEFNAQDLANTALAFSKLGHFDSELFRSLGNTVEWHLSNFSVQGLVNTVWAFAKAGFIDTSLYSNFAKSIKKRLPDFNSQDLANIAWSLAKACHSDEVLFEKIARSSEKCLHDFNAQDLTNLAWAFAKLGLPDAKLFKNMEQAIIKGKMGDVTASHIAKFAWAFAKIGHKSQTLFTALVRWAEAHTDDFSATELATVAWALANADQLCETLFAALAKTAENFIEEFTEEELDNVEWAMGRAGQQKICSSLRRQRRKCNASAILDSNVGGSCGRILVAGGGIGGAALAVALEKHGFDVLVLEGDQNFSARKQGYGLTIQGYTSTTQALGIDLTKDDAPSTSHYTFSEKGQILGFFGEAFGRNSDRKESDNSGRFIHIPRQLLRSRLLEQVKPGIIRWGSKLESFECCSNGAEKGKGVTVTLTDGTKLDASLLIGSDGIYSMVRRNLTIPGDRLSYVGFIVVLGISEAPCTLANRRIFETVDGETRVYAMPFTVNSTMWQLSFPYPEDAARKLCKNPSKLRKEILRRCIDWHDPVPELLKSTSFENQSGYPVYDRELLDPSVLRKAVGEKRVTLIGDAAHPMTPFRAQGANQALSDAVLLAECLSEHVSKLGEEGLAAALPAFEKKMLNRSARAVAASREKAKELHSSLVLQPARKVQRETSVDMQEVVRMLQAQGIGASDANDPRGLDAVVSDAMMRMGSASDLGTTADPKPAPNKRNREVEDSDVNGGKMQRTGEYGRMRLWGYFNDEWHKCILLKIKKNGMQKVEWRDGTTSALSGDFIQPRVKKVSK